MTMQKVSLDDRFDLEKSPVLLNGTQALVRLMLMLGGAAAAWMAGVWWLAVLVAVFALVGTVLAGDTKGVAEAGR